MVEVRDEMSKIELETEINEITKKLSRLNEAYIAKTSNGDFKRSWTTRHNAECGNLSQRRMDLRAILRNM